MPVYRALILNKEISVNYNENEKEKLLKAVKEINSKLTNYDNLNGKISDTKILSFLAIKLQAELLDLKNDINQKILLEKKINETNSESINLNDKMYKLREENKFLKHENDLINIELKKIQTQIEIIMNLIKKIYEE